VLKLPPSHGKKGRGSTIPTKETRTTPTQENNNSVKRATTRARPIGTSVVRLSSSI